MWGQFDGIDTLYYLASYIAKKMSLNDCLKSVIKHDISGADDKHGESVEIQKNGNMNLDKQDQSVINLSGKYKLVHNQNFDDFLKALCIPLIVRKAANRMRSVHTITHDTENCSIRIQIDGIVKGDTTFSIGGPPGSSSIQHLVFDDYVSYVDDGSSIQVRKVARNAPLDGATELLIKRTLTNDGRYLLLYSKARFSDGSESTECIQTFERVVVDQ